jgi:hypothetical protein
METAKREREILTRLQKILKNKRLTIVVGAKITFNATAKASGKPFSRIKWTDLIENGLDFLINKGYINRANRRTKRAYEVLNDLNINNLLNAANILNN